MKNKIIAILGPTASGKSDWAVKLAKSIGNAEIISVDSRQVYKGMDLGTGKITKKEMKGVPHHLIDVASPKRKFTFAQYKIIALKALKEIFKKEKIAIICGGTLFYLYSFLNNKKFPEVEPDWNLRKKLERENTEELFKKLEKIDKRRASKIDRKNKRRIIRAIEVVLKTKKPVEPIKENPLPWPVLKIGVKKNKEEIKELIEKRLLKRINKGMIKEVERLHKEGVSFKRLESFGLEYEWIAKFLQNKISKEEMTERLQKAIKRFSKNQIKILEKDKEIKWFKNYKEAEKEAKNFLKTKK
jgi:tRNA dimethylallyltransferase